MTSPTTSIRSVYLDSCVLIAAVAHPDKQVQQELRDLFAQIQGGSITAFTSTFTRAEVRQFRRNGKLVPMPNKDAAAVAALLASRSLVRRPVIESISDRAAVIGNNHPDLMPADCVHIATAEQVNVDVLFTFDGGYKVGRRKPGKMLTYDKHFTNGLRIRPAFNPLGGLFDLQKMA